MDAVECMKAVTRMLTSGTIDCAIQKYISAQKQKDYERMVKAVEQWAKEHPVKTRQSEFLKQWPHARLVDGKWLPLCPKSVERDYEPAESCDLASCAKCRKEFWTAEVEEK